MIEPTLHVPTTTYRYCYRGDVKHLSPVKYHQLKSIVHRYAKQQPPRFFPIQPPAPHRILQKDPEGPVVGLGTKCESTEKFLDPKPIVKTAPPQEIYTVKPEPTDGLSDEVGYRRTSPAKEHVFVTKFGPMASSEIDSLMHKYKWTSTTKHHNGEACLPVFKVDPPKSTIERKADPIRLRGQRYEEVPEDWQQAVLWDRFQLRGMVHHEDLKEKSTGIPEKLLHKRAKEGRPPVLEKRLRINSAKIRKHIANKDISNIFVRQCPGYAGFVPRARQPPSVQMDKQPERPQMTSVMKASYRELPLKEYQSQSFARKGPMSRTITLTYPFNPFNKITNEPVIIP